MSSRLSIIALSLALALAACGKKHDAAKQEDQPASTPSAQAAAPAPEATAEQKAAAEKAEAAKAELAKKQAQLDYATLEDSYINDPKAQWASAGKASSTFGEDRGSPSESSLPVNMTGKVDGKTWNNNNQSIGFDWAELSFDKPVSATEVRFVFPRNKTVLAVSKVELQDVDGGWHTVWSGISDVKPDERGDRTWFVRKFDATPYKVKGAKLTIANNLDSNYKEIDAVQLVGQ